MLSIESIIEANMPVSKVQRVCRLSLDCRFAHFLSLEGLCYNVVLFLF